MLQNSTDTAPQPAGRYEPSSPLPAASARGVTYRVRSFAGAHPPGELYVAIGNDGAIHLHVMDPELAQRAKGVMKTAYERASQAAHPRLLKAVDLVAAGDVHAIVSEMAQGPMLADYIAEYGPLPVPIALELFSEIAEALNESHKAGVHHGCLYPGSIWVELDGAAMVPRIGGFHLATLLDKSESLATATASYRSAKRAEGNDRAGIFDDVYSVGALLMFSLTGERPGTPAAGKALREIPGLPDEMSSMLGQCLQADPEKRFQSLVAVRNVLGTLLELHQNQSQRAPERPEKGDEIAGNYVVEKLLGEGGMARVYLARDKSLGTRVAIKLLNASCLDEPPVVERFLQEASIQAKLVHPEPHPNVVAVLRVLNDEPIGYVMEYVDGTTLDEVLAQEPLSEATLLDVFAQICDGLHHAHENRIIHRDLKPSNILMSKDVDGSWIAKLMDFGISKQLDQPKTRTNLVLGTLGYIAPELFVSAKDASAQSDVYAIGCCLFESFTGDVPFAVSDGGLRSLAFRVYNETAPTVSERGGSVSPELEALIALTLNKAPSDRPESAGWLAARLKALALGSPDTEISALIDREKFENATTARASLGKTTRRNLAAGNTTARTGEPGKRRVSTGALIAILAALLAVVGAVVFVATRGEDPPPKETEAEADPQPEEPAPEPVEVAPDPVPEETEDTGPNVLPASRVLGAADLLAQARAAAASGDKREALRLYAEAAAKLDEDGTPEAEISDTLVEMANLYEEVAAESEGQEDVGNEDVEALDTERRELLASAAQAYGRAAEMESSYDLFMKKYEVDQERGDASGALESLRDALEVAESDEQKKDIQKKIKRIEEAFGGGSSSKSKEKIPSGPLPDDQIEVWVESRPAKPRAEVYLGKRRLGKTPLIRRFPKDAGKKIDLIVKSKGRYSEKVGVDAAAGGKFTVKMSWKPRKID